MSNSSKLKQVLSVTGLIFKSETIASNFDSKSSRSLQDYSDYNVCKSLNLVDVANSNKGGNLNRDEEIFNSSAGTNNNQEQEKGNEAAHDDENFEFNPECLVGVNLIKCLNCKKVIFLTSLPKRFFLPNGHPMCNKCKKPLDLSHLGDWRKERIHRPEDNVDMHDFLRKQDHELPPVGERPKKERPPLSPIGARAHKGADGEFGYQNTKYLGVDGPGLKKVGSNDGGMMAGAGGSGMDGGRGVKEGTGIEGGGIAGAGGSGMDGGRGVKEGTGIEGGGIAGAGGSGMDGGRGVKEGTGIEGGGTAGAGGSGMDGGRGVKGGVGVKGGGTAGAEGAGMDGGIGNKKGAGKKKGGTGKKKGGTPRKSGAETGAAGGSREGGGKGALEGAGEEGGGTAGAGSSGMDGGRGFVSGSGTEGGGTDGAGGEKMDGGRGFKTGIGGIGGGTDGAGSTGADGGIGAKSGAGTEGGENNDESELKKNIRKSIFAKDVEKNKGRQRKTLIVTEAPMRQRKSTIMISPEDRKDLNNKQMSGARRQSLAQIRERDKNKGSMVFGQRKSTMQSEEGGGKKSIAFTKKSILYGRKSRMQSSRKSVALQRRLTESKVEVKMDISDIRKKVVFNNRERSNLGRMRMADIEMLSNLDSDTVEGMSDIDKEMMLDKMSKVAQMTSEFQSELDEEVFYALNDSDSYNGPDDEDMSEYEAYKTHYGNVRKSTMKKKSYYHDVDEEDLCFALSDIHYLTRHSNIVGPLVVYKFSAKDVGPPDHELNFADIPLLNIFGLHYLPLRSPLRKILFAFNSMENAELAFTWYKCNMMDKERDFLHSLYIIQPIHYGHRMHQTYKLSETKIDHLKLSTAESRAISTQFYETAKGYGLETDFSVHISYTIGEDIVNTSRHIRADVMVVSLSSKKGALSNRSLPRTGQFLVENARCAIYFASAQLNESCFAK